MPGHVLPKNWDGRGYARWGSPRVIWSGVGISPHKTPRTGEKPSKSAYKRGMRGRHRARSAGAVVGGLGTCLTARPQLLGATGAGLADFWHRSACSLHSAVTLVCALTRINISKYIYCSSSLFTRTPFGTHMYIYRPHLECFFA